MLAIPSFLRFFFFKQKTAYELRISDWSSDVCSSDLTTRLGTIAQHTDNPPIDSPIGAGIDQGLQIAAFPGNQHRNACAHANKPKTAAGNCRRGVASEGSSHEIGRASCRERV